MPCVHVRLPGGGAAIVKLARWRENCSIPGCRKPHIALCDFEVSVGKTCDARLCITHAHHLVGGVDYCPQHAPDGQGELL